MQQFAGAGAARGEQDGARVADKHVSRAVCFFIVHDSVQEYKYKYKYKHRRECA